MWEKKTYDGTVHAVGARYSWSTGAPWKFDGTAKTDFLDKLNDEPTHDPANCFAGYCDWRLPSVGEDGGTRELETILDKTQGFCGGGTSGACVLPGLGSTQSGGYWSSTPFASNPYGAWVVFFNVGSVSNDLGKDSISYVRAVRGGL
jgi:hypothetical protein